MISRNLEHNDCHLNESCHEKTFLQGLRPGSTKTACAFTEDGYKLELSELKRV